MPCLRKGRRTRGQESKAREISRKVEARSNRRIMVRLILLNISKETSKIQTRRWKLLEVTRRVRMK